jgi:2,5-diketo-D-gluconate reductase A
VITSVCKAHDRSAAQIILRWHIQHGHIVIPKSSSPERMKENIALFDFELTADEMAQIDALDRGEAGRIGPHPNTFAQIP